MYIVSFIIVFGAVVFFHELGHYTMARIHHVTIKEFAIGMGPAIYSKTSHKTDIKYSLRVIPLGGYVAMEGENETSEDENAFGKKGPWQRLSILLAGAFNNFITAYILIILFFIFVGSPTTTIGSVFPDTPAAIAGIQKGDQVVAVNKHIVTTWEQVTQQIQLANGHTIHFTFIRDGIEKEILVTPELVDEVYKVGILTEMQTDVSHSFVNGTSLYGTFFTSIIDFFRNIGSVDIKKDVMGPVGMVQFIGQATTAGWLNLLMIASFISVNLGIINLLPLPALDGGRALFVIVELIIGKRVNQNIEAVVHMIGFLLLIGFSIFIFYNDIVRLVSGGS